MSSRDIRIDAYVKKAAPFAQPILDRLRKTVRQACPDVEETMRWGFPQFDYKGVFCSVAAFKAHVAFRFWKASILGDRLSATARATFDRFDRIESMDDLPAEKTLIEIVRRAAELNDEGVKLARTKPVRTPAVTVPAFFAAALRKNAMAKAAFAKLSPSHRREYVEWLTEAKTPETRERRMAQAIEWIANGKSRNWKYER